MVLRGVRNGLVAGAAGATVMTLAAKTEQLLTRRPDSYVPAHTLARLLGLRDEPDERRTLLAHAMHYGTGMAVGALRGVMAEAGLQGPWASAMHTVVRLTTDQTLENATGVGAPPWTWPRDEVVIDVAHKAVYSFAAGAVADALAGPRAKERRPPPGAQTPSRRRVASRWRRPA
jgi:hypothetical protein